MRATIPILDGGDRVGDLEVQQDLEFQSRAWLFQRVGWAIMALVVLAAAVGLFGQGPMAVTTADNREGAFRVEYARFARHQSPESIEIGLTADATGEQARISFERSYLDAMTVEEVYPEPESVEAGPDQVTYVFSLSDAGTATTVLFSVRYQDIGRLRGNVAVEGHTPVELSQFIYP